MAVKARDPATLLDPLIPDNWYGWCFELVLNNQALVALPPTLRIDGELGPTDPSEYDHAPFDDVWYRLGDEIPTERPLLRLAGQHTYRSDDEALTHTAEIERAVAIADAVYWRGRFLISLNTLFPNTVTAQSGDLFRETTFAFQLNTTTRLTRTRLAEVQR